MHDCLAKPELHINHKVNSKLCNAKTYKIKKGGKMKATEFVSGSGIGKFLKAGDVKTLKLKGKPLVIRNVKSVELQGKKKLVLGFESIDQRLVLNATNTRILIEDASEETDEWIGKVLTLNVVKVNFNGETVDSIQIDADN